jgi:hypothetical protein
VERLEQIATEIVERLRSERRKNDEYEVDGYEPEAEDAAEYRLTDPHAERERE